MYLKLDDIKEIQLDHTTRCNLSCPQCARTADNWAQEPHNKNIDLSVEDYKIILEPFQAKAIKLFHCGNYGDALASPNFEDTFKFSLNYNLSRITVATNGSLRSPDWWRQFAKTGGDQLRVTFSIDGLSKTNAIYRIGASWDKIMANAKAFIDAGGWARWDFIEFHHNYHEIEEARQLASQMGFKIFNVKYTARFATLGIKTEDLDDGSQLIDRNTNVNQGDFEEVKKTYGSFDEYVEKTPISCKSIKESKVFIDMHMRLWPCCWFGAPPYFKRKSKQVESFLHLEKLYGSGFNNLREKRWDVLNHEFFQDYLSKSWDSPSDKYKRIYTCGRTCGQKFEFSSGYGKNTNIEVIQSGAL